MLQPWNARDWSSEPKDALVVSDPLDYSQEFQFLGGLLLAFHAVPLRK
jgi:hypothetical protein